MLDVQDLAECKQPTVVAQKHNPSQNTIFVKVIGTVKTDRDYREQTTKRRMNKLVSGSVGVVTVDDSMFVGAQAIDRFLNLVLVVGAGPLGSGTCILTQLAS